MVDESGTNQLELTLIRLVNDHTKSVEPDGFRRLEVSYNHTLVRVNVPDSIDEAFSNVSWSSINKIVYEITVAISARRIAVTSCTLFLTGFTDIMARCYRAASTPEVSINT